MSTFEEDLNTLATKLLNEEIGREYIPVESPISVEDVREKIENRTRGRKTIRKGHERTKEYKSFGQIVTAEEVVLVNKLTAREEQEWRDEVVERNQARELGPDCYTG